MRVAAIAWSLMIPGLQTYLFRRTYPDLIANHMQGPSSLPMMVAPLVVAGKCTVVADEVRFTNGSRIKLCHCQHEKDVIKYQGSEIHFLLVDELTHLTEIIYRFLRGRVRIGGLHIPEKYKGMFPRILCASNPGSIGHQFVKRMFIDSIMPMDIVPMEKEEGGMLRQFVPALLDDNPTLMENDPDYEHRLEGLGSPDLVKAMRYGLWDITAGAAFEKLFRDKHMLRPFRVPQHWTKFTSLDWGTAKPFSVGWYCVCDDDLELTAKDNYPARLVPRGAIIRYREYYGWNGKPNEGCRMESFEVAQRIIEIEDEEGELPDYRIGDSSMWSQHDGPTVAERMYTGTNGRYDMAPCSKDRINNYQEFRARLAGQDDVPMFYVTANCKHWWRTVPDLQLDETHPEKGPDSEQEDHCFISGTGIITDHGIKPIEQIKTGDKVMTTQGLRPCIQLGERHDQETYTISFNDAEYTATGNHPFLADNGMYVRLDSLRIEDNIACIESYRKPSRSLCLATRDYSVVGNVSNSIGAIPIRAIVKDSERKSVWNLHVPGANNFLLSNGVIVHNCYDDTQYALASRPMLITKRQRTDMDYEKARKRAGMRKKKGY